MRLLNVHSQSFRNFHSANVPKYVVASHRWSEGAEAEATIKDVQKRKHVEKSGYRKVEGFVRFVKENIVDIEWIWIDTCCINQESSQEVSEAINSMFKWYRNAEVCLAYLVDVKSGDKGSFEQSTWFKRGWTLQELLAPHTVLFLTQDWQVIGHKGANGYSKSGHSLHAGTSLEPTIAAITKIPEAVLRDYKRSPNLDINQKLAWTEGRETTRDEDMSYCLLGIFDVTMVANYGEGGDRAKRRLLAEISNGFEALGDFLSPSTKAKRSHAGLLMAKGATYNSLVDVESARCLAGTRTDLLRKIDDWAHDSEGESIFWLCGKAGTGKSTICRTVAHNLDTQSCLGASFFFKRNEGDRGNASRFFPTLAGQLADVIPGMDPSITDALNNDSFVCERNLQAQFEKLFMQPLANASQGGSESLSLVVVIDALDECERSTDIRTILSLLARVGTIGSIRLRIFVTSRPELPVQLGFRSMGGDLHQDIMLEDAQATTIEHDIRVYFDHRFEEIKAEDTLRSPYDPLPSSWPGEDNIEALVNLAVPLFSFAFTVCRYISESNPQERLQTVLRQRMHSFTMLDKTYLPILNQLLLDQDPQRQNQAVAEFRELVGPIVLVADPLSAASLSGLLDIPLRVISERIRPLHSVLDIPPAADSPIRLLHLSFRDFLVNPEGKATNSFWIDESNVHGKLTERCLSRLNQPGTLRYDVCNVEKPGTKRAEIIRPQESGVITAEVAYACCYWVLHLERSGELIHDNGQVHEFLQSHLLHWLEALGWLGRASDAVLHISTLRSIVEPIQGPQVLALLDDARRFVLQNRYILDIAPLQLYHSGLTFAPTRSIIRRMFEMRYPRFLSLLSSVPLTWSPEIQKLEGHSGWVTTVAFSPDGQMIASGSTDKTIRLWNAITGEEVQQLKGHDNDLVTVAFSPNSQTIVSTSGDRTARLWNATTGEEIQRLEGYGIRAAIFSPDGETIGSGSKDGTVQLWHAMSGEEIRKLEGHNHAVIAIDFSPDGWKIASSSYDSTLRIWNVRTGEEMHKLEWDDDGIWTLAFSPGGQSIVVAGGNALRLLNAETGEETLNMEADRYPGAVAFSPHGKTIASRSGQSVRLLDAATGEVIQNLEGHVQIVSELAFSPDGLTIASASYDGTVRIWDVIARKKMQKLEGHDLRVEATSFSSDGRTVVSSSVDRTVRLWNAKTGKEIQMLVVHNHGWANDIAFSPDGQMLALSFDNDKIVRVWSATIWREIQQLRGHDRKVTAVAFSPDGRTLASSSEDSTVRVWSTTTWEETQRLVHSIQRVEAVAFSPDGQTLASSDYRQNVVLWDIRKGEKIHQFCAVNDVFKLWFTRDGKSLRTEDESFDLGRDSCSSFVTGSKDTVSLGLGGPWIKYNDQEVLWLPHEYRGEHHSSRGKRWSSHGNSLVIGQVSGAMTFFEFAPAPIV